jgi:hypothetical protein
MNIAELLHLRGLPRDSAVKLVRHRDDKRYDMAELQREGLIELYQSYQTNRSVYNACDVVVSFIGEQHSRARLYGVYRVGKEHQASEFPLPPKFKYPGFNRGGWYYQLDKMEGFEDLEHRVVIDWGKGERAWFQWMDRKPKEVLEVLPRGFVQHFPGYFEFILSYSQLTQIVLHPEANREWHQLLRAVGGVYLISDEQDGKLYVGSATGEHGILGRWSTYARAPDGGNVRLRALLEKDATRVRHFRYSILHTLPRTLAPAVVLEYERLYKRKLGTRAYGLNLN